MGILRRLRGKRSGAYDGGGFDRKNQTGGWSVVGGTGEEINQLSRDNIRARARDLERNSDNVGAIIDAMERGVVGTGIKLQAKAVHSDGSDDKDLNEQIEELWRIWSKPKNCDVAGRMSLSEIQDMATRRRMVDGGLMIVKCTVPDGKIPLQLQLKEVDELDTSVSYYQSGDGNHKVVQGIELNASGRIMAYHFKEYDLYGWTGRSVRVPSQHVIYLSHRTRPSEIREFSPLAKIIVRLRDLTQYMQAVSVKERVLACLSVFIEKAGGYGGYGRDRQQKDPSTGYRQKKLTPGMIEELSAGDKVQVVNPSGQASNARDFVTMMLRSIGSSLGLSYEATSRDMSQVNYSSARQGLIDDTKTYNRWQNYLTEHLLVPVYEEFLDSCVLSGALRIPDYFTHRERYTRCHFIPNGMPWIDPLKEASGNKVALETGQTNLATICAARGENWRDILDQRGKEIQYMREIGILPAMQEGEGSIADEAEPKAD